MPPTRLPTTARPRQNASTTTRPRPSEREGRTRVVASSSARATSGVGQRLVPAHLLGKLGCEARGDLAERPASDEVEQRTRYTRRGEAPRLGEHVDGLVALEHADEERGRPLGKRRGLRREERVQVHERREGRGRLARQPRARARTCRRRSCARRRPAAVPGGRGGRRAARAPFARRPVEARGRGRVSVDVRDHAGRNPGEPTAEEDERGLLPALGEDGVGPVLAELPRDAERQERVEGRARPAAVAGRDGRAGTGDRLRHRPRPSRARERRAPRRARRTSGRARARAAARTGSARRAGASASSPGRPRELFLDPGEDRLLRVARPRRARPSRPVASSAPRRRRTSRSRRRARRGRPEGRAARSLRRGRPRARRRPRSR